MLVFLAVVIGLLLGSFLSVLLERLSTGKGGIVAGRSECPHCHHVLAWYDLVPLVSYVWLRGQCRYCSTSISVWYPTLELAMAGVFAGYAITYDISRPWEATGLIIVFALVSLFFFDLRYQFLPDVIILPLIAIVLVRMIAFRHDLLLNSIAMGIGLASLFGLLYLISHGRWIGLGDVKLAIPMGMLFGFPSAIGVTLVAIWSGAIIGVLLMAFGRAGMKSSLPFGSFWTAAGIAALLWPMPFELLSHILIP